MLLEDKIKIMQAFADGEEIEYKSIYSSSNTNNWIYESNPLWNWTEYDYRIRQITWPLFKKRKNDALVVLFTDKRSGYAIFEDLTRDYQVGSYLTNWCSYDEDIWEDIEDEEVFPIYLQSRNDTIVKYTSITDGYIIKNGDSYNCSWEIGEKVNPTLIQLLSTTDNNWSIIELKENKDILIEKWLCKSSKNHYETCETSDIDLHCKILKLTKIKILESYTVEIEEKNK